MRTSTFLYINKAYAWEQRKFSDEADEIIAGGDIDKDKAVENGKYPIYANALTNDGVVGYYEDEYRVKAPAVTVTGRGEVGHAQARTIDFTPVVRLLSVKSKHDVYFLENAINNHKVVQESTGVPQLTVPQLGSYQISFPSSLDEEAKIGELFHKLDHLITLHQRKYDALKSMKKTLLSKMFPKNGEDVPEIRFKGFTDAWEQRKLGALVQFVNGRAYKQEELLDVGKYKVVRVGNFNTNEKWYFSDLELETDKYMDNGDLLYLWATSFGPVIWQGEKAIFHYHIWKLKNFESLDKKYLYSFLEWDKHKISQNTNGSTMVHITKNMIEQRDIEYPTKSEQYRIGSLLESVDNLITLHQRKLDELKNMKKTLLQQMFV